MREIKFRAWNERENKMIYFDLETLLNLQGKMETGYLGIEDIPSNRMYETVMQYTGLKDKNGKEIYEGDIVKSLYGYKSNKLLTVIFEHGCFFLFKESIATRASFEVLMLQDFEVVGNIYENPELLNSPKEKV